MICSPVLSGKYCGDGSCISPEFEGNCASDCGNLIKNSHFMYSEEFLKTPFWASSAPDKNNDSLGLNLGYSETISQNKLVFSTSDDYELRLNTSESMCFETFIHNTTHIVHSARNITLSRISIPKSESEWTMSIRAACVNVSVYDISLTPIPKPNNQGWKYYDIVDSIIATPGRLSPNDCRQECMENTRCCAWQVCPDTEAEGCLGCYLLGRKPEVNSIEAKSNWFAGIIRAKPSSDGYDIESCRNWMLKQSSHESDFYTSPKLQKYIDCGIVIRRDRLVPKQIFMGGSHIPTLMVANHRTPDPRLVKSDSTNVPPFFFILPFYDTNIGNIMKHTSSMNLVQSYEMQSILNSGDVFVDIGANLGSYTIPIAQHVGPLGTVISFEPFRWLYQMLNANIAANGLMNCWTYQIALSDSPNRLYLLQPNLRYFSSPGGIRFEGQPTNTSSENTRQMYDLEWGKELVDAWRLDDIIFSSSPAPAVARKKSPTIDLIKIDVEGMEQQVLKGAVRVLAELKPIVWVENVAYFADKDMTFLNWFQNDQQYVCYVSVNAGNDFVCEPNDGSRHARLARVGLRPVTPVVALEAGIP